MGITDRTLTIPASTIIGWSAVALQPLLVNLGTYPSREEAERALAVLSVRVGNVEGYAVPVIA